MLLNKISSDLLLPEFMLEGLANSASYRYKSYYIKKATGGERLIEHPSRELKAIQRYLLDNILILLPVHSSAAAYIKNKGLRDHVEVHRKSKYILRTDFKDFFPSLTATDITLHCDKYQSLLPENWNTEDTQFLVKFVCRSNKLTIGAVTSPYLSNTLCYDLDTVVNEKCKLSHINYTRYADDMYFSSNEPNVLFNFEKEVTKIVEEIKYPANLTLNERKTNHISKKYRRKVTGLIITPEGKISIGRRQKRYLRSLIFNWENLQPKQKSYLVGYLSYCKAVEPSFLNAIYQKYGADRIKFILRSKEFS